MTTDTPLARAVAAGLWIGPTPVRTTAPAYSIQSVDNALRLLLMLRRDGHLRVTHAAAELNVARSTAHRLISMLRFRGFVEQAPNRTYVATSSTRAAAGNGLDGRAHTGDPVVSASALGGIARPHLIRLADRVTETVTLSVRRGTEIEFIDLIEAKQPLHIGHRIGARKSARTTAVGAVLLAHLPLEAVRALFIDLEADDPAWLELRRSLLATRSRGFAVVCETSDRGVTAIARPIYGTSGSVIAAVSVAAPITRYKPHGILNLLPDLTRAVEDIRTDVLSMSVPRVGYRPIGSARAAVPVSS